MPFIFQAPQLASLQGCPPPRYSQLQSMDEALEPVALDGRTSGKYKSKIYFDAHCECSLICPSQIHESVKISKSPLRCHVDLPWKGQGIGFTYQEQADVSMFIAECLVLKHHFKVVQALRGGIILGRDFASIHDAHVEYVPGCPTIPYQLYVRERPLPCQRAHRAWQIEHTPGQYTRASRTKKLQKSSDGANATRSISNKEFFKYR